jgi:DUF1680 family protein
MLQYRLRQTLVAVGLGLAFVPFALGAPPAEPVQPKVHDALTLLPPRAVRIGGHLGGQIDLSIRQRIAAQDVEALLRPFRERKDTRQWRSEFWGKWITSAIAAYRYTGDPKLRAIIEQAEQGLLATQTADGYIGAYPNGGHLMNWDVWGRKYTLLGLLAWYDVTGDQALLTGARRHADFMLSEIGPGKASPFTNDMWGGMASSSVLEPTVLLYRRTAEPRYLEFAQYLLDQWATPKGPDLLRKALRGVHVFDMFAGPKPVVKGFMDQGHAKSYEMMSCYEGLAELYRVSGKPEYVTAVRKVYQDIHDTEITVIGSGSDWERWCSGRNRQTKPWRMGMETCVTVTWLKFAAQLLRLTGEPAYADDLEQGMYNALLGAQALDGTWWCHHSPLVGRRERAPEQCDMHQNCCVANGPRGLTLLPQVAVMSGREGPVVNLYGRITATAPLAAGNAVRIEQESDYPIGDTIRIRLTPQKPEQFTLRLRIPQWSANSSLLVNGQAQPAPKPGTYAAIARVWKPGDQVTLQLDLRARLIAAPGDPTHCAVVRGPIVLARDRRLDAGDLDAPATIAADAAGHVPLMREAKAPANVWMLFRVPLKPGPDGKPAELRMCDFSSAGNTWSEASQYRVWIPRSQ